MMIFDVMFEHWYQCVAIMWRNVCRKRGGNAADGMRDAIVVV